MAAAMMVVRFAFLLVSSALAVSVVRFENATKEIDNIETFYDAVLSVGAPALLGGVPLVNGSLQEMIPCPHRGRRSCA